METRKLKLALSAGALALSMALAGCGGGGSSPQGTVPDPTPVQVAEMAYEKAEMAYEALADDATNEEKLKAAEDLHAAAMKLESELRDANASVDEVEDAEQEVADAAEMVSEIQGAINQAAQDAQDAETRAEAIVTERGKLTMAQEDNAEALRGADPRTRLSALNMVRSAAVRLQMALEANDEDTGEADMAIAIADAGIVLSNAEIALDGVPENAELEDKRDAHQAVADAAKMLVEVLAANGGSEADIDLAEDRRDVAVAGVGSLDFQISERNKASDKNQLAMAKTLFGGLKTNRDPNSLFDIVAGGPEFTSADVSAEYGKATVIIAADNAELAKDDKPKVAENGKWSSTITSGMVKGVHIDEVKIYTNIEKPKMVDFGEVHPLTAGSRTISSTNTSMVGTEGFHQGNAPMSHASDEDNVAELIRIRGTFDGASGTYRCTESATDKCTSQTDGKKGVILAGGTWTFEPDADVQAPALDKSYAYFGWWLRKNAAGNEYKVAAFDGLVDSATPVNAWDTDEYSALTGTAKYMGPAVGQYARHDAGDHDEAYSGGRFTATADLMVDFDTNMIGGEVLSFVDADGQSLPFKVDFADTTITAGDGSFGGGADIATWVIGETPSDTKGTYEGNLREQDKLGEPDTATGTWSVPFNDAGHMVGAFGAENQGQ